VICSFSVRSGLPGLVLRLRGRLLGARSNAVRRTWLERAAADAGLRIVRDIACTSHIGAERTVLFAKA
jgi:hypothetical protein